MRQNTMLAFDLPPQTRPLTTAEAQIYIAHELNGVTIRQRRGDDYIDVTAMCRAGGKVFHEWRRIDGTDRYLAFVSETTGIPSVNLIESTEGRGGGTFAEPHIALRIASWVSPEFQFYVDDWFLKTAIAGGQADLTGANFETRRLVKTFQTAAAIDVDALADKVTTAVVAATRDDFRRVEGVVRSELEKQIKPLGIDVNCNHSILVGMQTDLWGYFKLDPAALQKLQQKHEHDREAKKVRTGEYVDPQTGEVRKIPPLAEPRKE